MESPKHGLVRYIYPASSRWACASDGTEKVWPCFRLRPFEPPIPMEGIYSVYFLDRTGMQTKGGRGCERHPTFNFRYVANIRTIEENPRQRLGPSLIGPLEGAGEVEQREVVTGRSFGGWRVRGKRLR